MSDVDTYLTSTRNEFRYKYKMTHPIAGNPIILQRVPANILGVNGPTLANYGVTGKFQYIKVLPLANTNEVHHYFDVPVSFDPKSRLYLSATLIGKSAIASNVTLTFTILKMVKGSTAGGNPSVALDQAVDAIASSDYSVDTPFDTKWGYINPSSVEYDSYQIKMVVSAQTGDANKLCLINLNVAYIDVNKRR